MSRCDHCPTECRQGGLCAAAPRAPHPPPCARPSLLVFVGADLLREKEVHPGPTSAPAKIPSFNCSRHVAFFLINNYTSLGRATSRPSSRRPAAGTMAGGVHARAARGPPAAAGAILRLLRSIISWRWWRPFRRLDAFLAAGEQSTGVPRQPHAPPNGTGGPPAQRLLSAAPPPRRHAAVGLKRRKRTTCRVDLANIAESVTLGESPPLRTQRT